MILSNEDNKIALINTAGHLMIRFLHHNIIQYRRCAATIPIKNYIQKFQFFAIYMIKSKLLGQQLSYW